jgi:phosphoribosylformimino-5-aminoimidazole carboxamide ribotide isomerase
MIIFPAIDIRGGKCVRLLQGDYNRETVYSENPAEQAELWQKQGGRFLHLVDLDGAREGHPVNLKTVKAICEKIEIPCELGGGIRTYDDATRVLDLGVARIILGTAACDSPTLVEQLIEKLGAEKIVIGIDARDGKAAIKGWLESSGRDAVELAVKFSETGVKRIIYTDISTDGMLKGPNLEAVAKLCDRIPEGRIIASGGVSRPRDIKNLKALEKANLEGAIVGKALYDGRTSLKELSIAAGD